MKILHVSGSKVWGGNEQQLVDLVIGLNKKNISNLILCVPSSALQQKVEKLDLKYSVLPQKKRYYFSYAKSLKQVVKIFKPDIIHLHTSNSTTFFLIADILYGLSLPTIFSKKGIKSKNGWLSKLKYNYKGFDKVLCVSKAVSEAFKEVLKSKNHHKLCVIYDGIKVENPKTRSDINFREIYGISSDKILIGNIANHVGFKDLVTLVETINILVNKLNIKNFHLIQIGSKTKYSDEFIPLIAKYNIESYITIAGFVENAVDLISQLDIYFMSSEREGLPLTIYEAFLHKVSVVSTKAGGIAEAIEHGYNGLLSEIKDAEGLAKNLKDLMNDADKRKLFAERSYKLLFEKYTVEHSVANTLNLYKQLINDKK